MKTKKVVKDKPLPEKVVVPIPETISPPKENVQKVAKTQNVFPK
jgi:hypothetical protein